MYPIASIIYLPFIVFTIAALSAADTIPITNPNNTSMATRWPIGLSCVAGTAGVWVTTVSTTLLVRDVRTLSADINTAAICSFPCVIAASVYV
jgi:hypothetical protein